MVWQHSGLKSLDADLQAQHGPGAAIIYRKGPYLQALQGIIAALDIGVLFYSRRYDRQANHLCFLVPARAMCSATKSVVWMFVTNIIAGTSQQCK